MKAIALMVVSLLALTGCSGGNKFDDLDAKLADSRNRPQGKIEPLPTYPPAERFSYSALAMRSPFEPPVVLTGDERVSGNAVSEPNQARQKEPLELVNYSALSMVGTLSKDAQTWALINDGEGRIHRVMQGNYLGRNFGKITTVNNVEVEVLETVPDGKGGCINRPRTLGMNEE
jgi:type IV pilus assembly protein PilP